MLTIKTIIPYFSVLITGATALIYQVLWQKYLTQLLGCDALATSLILAAFLGSLATGYYVSGKLSLTKYNCFLIFAFFEAITGLWCIFFPEI
ncbi:MAG: hypothetical protein KAI17_18115, partial [Thiotrichaceae bacterium]|nr:hypothetical protein [Thiotrichaceae bacterium]